MRRLADACTDRRKHSPRRSTRRHPRTTSSTQSHQSRRNSKRSKPLPPNTHSSLVPPPNPPTLISSHLYIKPVTPAANQKKAPGLAVRDVKGAELGHLITVSGIVTRVSDVKPAVEVQAYTCDRCGTEVFQEVKRREFGPLIECPGECKTNDGKGQLFMSTRASKFNPFQDVKIQELTHQVPTGHIPRSLTVHLYGPITRSVSPGDVVDVSGIFLPVPYTGFKAVRAGLLTDTLLEAQVIEKKIKQYSAIESTAEIEAKINRLREGDDVYGKLSKSIAPEIYGHEDVKKALLLLLVGGVTKEMGDGMRIRGDINICLMGDPGVAKSQLLKYMSKVAPRGVYTTGRGSSGVGLTAAVMRDPVTDEMVLGILPQWYSVNTFRGRCTCSCR